MSQMHTTLNCKGKTFRHSNLLQSICVEFGLGTYVVNYGFIYA